MELSGFARSLTAEAAFTVLAVAKRLQSEGKDVVELEIGDSPFATTSAAVEAGREAIAAGHTRYCASLGLPELRDAAARYMRDEFGVPAGRENVVIATGTKVFEQYFCDAFVDPGDGVLVFSPYFPTYVPNILRRGGRPVFTPLRQEDAFRPSLAAVERFLAEDPRPRAIFLSSPHNPTGGVATEEDFRG
ncbi:MAG: aminotransferase class I/II-fold pyridoxal phosphate-dependent enzyme, partial [Gammaproteobacteria bacterium]|nr:aminotransferase class I/II-fold pyridoxal phosphate-dependent enzyme [Gammaproteobacteria bacterium]